jgi:hypothetical protein
LTTITTSQNYCGGYLYFGDLIGPDTFTISHPGISSGIYFHQVKIMYSIITFDLWGNTYSVFTKFTTPGSAPTASQPIDVTLSAPLCKGAAA